MRFVNESAKTVVECTYDYMGRRHTRKVSVNGTVSSYLRYMYRGYLQIAAIDAVSGAFRWFLFWDPTQPEATRPLAIRKDFTMEPGGPEVLSEEKTLETVDTLYWSTDRQVTCPAAAARLEVA